MRRGIWGRLAALTLTAGITAAGLLTSAGTAFAQETCPKPPMPQWRDAWALAVTWQPGFCDSFNTKNRPLPKECPTASKLNTFTLHGLWPQWQEYCVAADVRGEACDLNRDEMPAVRLSPDLAGRLAAIMPGVQSQLERHEYFKHGTCSGLAQEDYFDLAVGLTEKLNRTSLPGFLQQHVGSNVTKRQLCDAVEKALGPQARAAVEADHKTVRGDNGERRFYLVELRFWLKPAGGKLDLAAENFMPVKSGAKTLGPVPADALCDDNLDKHVYYIDRPGMGR